LSCCRKFLICKTQRLGTTQASRCLTNSPPDRQIVLGRATRVICRRNFHWIVVRLQRGPATIGTLRSRFHAACLSAPVPKGANSNQGILGTLSDTQIAISPRSCLLSCRYASNGPYSRIIMEYLSTCTSTCDDKQGLHLSFTKETRGRYGISA